MSEREQLWVEFHDARCALVEARYDMVQTAQRLLVEGLPLADLCRVMGIHRSTWFRMVNEYGDERLRPRGRRA